MRINISSFFFAFFLILMLSPIATAESYSATAELSTTWSTNYSAVNPILRRETNVAVFTCGFFCEDNCTFYYFAIFISPSTESPGQSKFVWSAKQPVRENAILNFTAAGDLVLVDVDGFIVWNTDTAGKSVAGMNLTDTGNLVLFDDQNSVVWQSFDDPTDSLLPGQKLFQEQELQSHTSLTQFWEGMYSLKLTDTGVFGYAYNSQLYYRWLVYGKGTYKGRRYMKFLNGSLSFCIEYSSEPSEPVGVIGIPEASSAQYMKLMPDGHLQVFEWQLKEWKVIKDLTTLFQSYSYTADLSTTWDTNYSDVQPMLLRRTNGVQFTCGFLCEGNCTDDNKTFHYIFAIFISPATNDSTNENKVVWSANRDHLVGIDAILNFTAAGELVLRDGDGSIVWTTNTAGKSVAGMNLTDTGNLVLFNDRNSH
ncbi:putative bulb-type lectin domain-containing protein [Helianthus annuus]|nr:putative bulb-type lectin domain-containing protein [Helianthus annuus]